MDWNWEDLSDDTGRSPRSVTKLSQSPARNTKGSGTKDHETFKALNNRRPDIKKVVTAWTGRKKKGVEDAQMDMDGEGDEDQ
jgi:hypothetical protein